MLYGYIVHGPLIQKSGMYKIEPLGKLLTSSLGTIISMAVSVFGYCQELSFQEYFYQLREINGRTKIEATAKIAAVAASN